MGAWSTGNFGNDTALDFANDVTSFAEILSTLATFEEQTDAMDADAACVALAACEFIATGIGRPLLDLPDVPDLGDVKLDRVSEQELKAAKSLIARVRDSSELAELWAEDDNTEWQSVLDDLVIRLTPSQPYDAPEPTKQEELPDDFLGYCYVCYGLVTERNGLTFEHTEEGLGTCETTPHRKCIEDQIPGPHWLPDGSPTPRTEQKLLQDMGVETEL